ncbi:MAG: hypothetical protein HYY23_22470 [Verrucomicrobia bacterium]|nr:hypothetical protein [Verrucomicrobiota bacterium]
MSDATRILDRVQQGDPRASEELLPLVYTELRRCAAWTMKRIDSSDFATRDSRSKAQLPADSPTCPVGSPALINVKMLGQAICDT